jgi:phosphoenolpyruvate synthase/pyruvate phosphate dikinase
MAVVIQTMVEADIAGVMFTRDPAPVPAERVIEASYGLGESVVAGLVVPDALKIEDSDTAETARRDLDRIFNTGGVAAVVGTTYGAAKDVGVYVIREAIRGLADLEGKERERCGNFASKSSGSRSR